MTCGVCGRHGVAARRCRFGAPRLCSCWRGVPCALCSSEEMCSMKNLLVKLRLMSASDSWGDLVSGGLMVGTFVGLVGLLLGVRIGWGDVLIWIGLWPAGTLPADPRRS